MGDIKVNTIKTNTLQASTGSNIAMTSGHTIQPNFHSSTAFPAGHIIQAKAVSYKGQISTTSTSHTAITDLAVTITPSSTSSKMLIAFNGYTYVTTWTRYMVMSVQRNVGGAGAADISGTTLYTDNNADGLFRIYDADAHVTFRNSGFQFIDSPNTTSSIVYNPTFRRGTDSATCYIGHSNMVSTFSVLEIAG